MKKLLFLLVLIIFTVIDNKVGATGPLNQYYYDDCDWYNDQQYIYCSQDWMLFVYIPLGCENSCSETSICLGLFPASEEEQVFELEDGVFCCEFLVTGQYGWLFEAGGTILLGNAGGVDVDFSVGEGNQQGNYNDVPNFFGGPDIQFALGTNLGGGLGVHYFELCANSVTIPGGFNGEANIGTVLQFIYSTF